MRETWENLVSFPCWNFMFFIDTSVNIELWTNFGEKVILIFIIGSAFLKLCYPMEETSSGFDIASKLWYYEWTK